MNIPTHTDVTDLMILWSDCLNAPLETPELTKTTPYVACFDEKNFAVVANYLSCFIRKLTKDLCTEKEQDLFIIFKNKICQLNQQLDNLWPNLTINWQQPARSLNWQKVKIFF